MKKKKEINDLSWSKCCIMIVTSMFHLSFPTDKSNKLDNKYDKRGFHSKLLTRLVKRNISKMICCGFFQLLALRYGFYFYYLTCIVKYFCLLGTGS